MFLSQQKFPLSILSNWPNTHSQCFNHLSSLHSPHWCHWPQTPLSSNVFWTLRSLADQAVGPSSRVWGWVPGKSWLTLLEEIALNLLLVLGPKSLKMCSQSSFQDWKFDRFSYTLMISETSLLNLLIPFTWTDRGWT